MTDAEVVDEETEEEEGTDALEVARIAFLVLGMAINLYMLWDYMKDQTEVLIWRAKVKNWWDRTVEAPQRLRRQENRVVFEAIQVVEDAP